MYKHRGNKFPSKLINGILSFLGTTSRLRLVTVYRPPYSAKHAVTTSTFYNGPFTDYLESLVMSSEPLIILGDFNIRMDLPVGYTGVDGSHAACLSTTHELGHTLDLIITRTSDNIIAACPSIGELFSDHFPVFCQDLIDLKLMSRMCSSGKWNQLTPTNFLRPFLLLSFIVIT